MNTAMKLKCLVGGLMLLSSAAAKILTPTVYLAESRPAMHLDEIVATQFGDWHEEKDRTSAVINPESQELINKIYAQTLSRTYVNSAGDRVMLSIAYGTDQRDSLQVHHPEICYPAQGFQVRSIRNGVLRTAEGEIPVKRLETDLGSQRHEPVTYWTTLGDLVVHDGASKRMMELNFGLRGQIPDGLLFRVSTIDTDTAHSFQVQDAFVGALALALAPAQRHRLMGLR